MGGIGQGRPGEPGSAGIWQDHEFGGDLGELPEVVSRRGKGSDIHPANWEGHSQRKCPYCRHTTEKAALAAASERLAEKTFNEESGRVSWAWRHPA